MATDPSIARRPAWPRHRQRLRSRRAVRSNRPRPPGAIRPRVLVRPRRVPRHERALLLLPRANLELRWSMGRRRSPSLVLGNRRREYTATHGSFRTTHGESRYHPKVAGRMRYADVQYPCDGVCMRSSPKKRIFLSPMQNYFGAFHRGGGGCADRSRRIDAADGCRRADCLRLPGLYSRHRSEHGSGCAV